MDELCDKPLAFSLALDPATGEAKQADDAAFTVRAVDQEGVWYLIDIFAANNMTEEEVAEKFISFLQIYPIDLCTIEGVSFARVFKRIIEKLCQERKVFFPFHPLPAGHNNANKATSDLKILGLAPFYSTGKIRFNKDCAYTEKLLDQMWRFPKATHDDILDSLSMHLHLPLYPTKIWKSRDIIKAERPLVGRYGEKIEKYQALGLYR